MTTHPSNQDNLTEQHQRADQLLSEALRDLHQGVLQEPVPQHLADAAVAVDQRLRRWHSLWQGGAIAASVVLAFGLGYWAGEQPPHTQGQQAADARFAHQAVLAHVVFAPEVRHPVEVDRSQQEHLLQWLSKRLNRPLKVPDLAPMGYELLGGRLLPAEGTGTRAQFMYQDAAGGRLTLYVGALDAAAAASRTLPGPGAETAFRFASDGPVSSFYWVDQGFGYALSGPVPRSKLQQLAQATYHQLTP